MNTNLMTSVAVLAIMGLAPEERDLQAGEGKQSEAQLELDVPRAISFRVQRVSYVASDADQQRDDVAGGGGAAAQLGVADELRFDFRTQSITTSKPAHEVLRTLVLDIWEMEQGGVTSSVEAGSDRPEPSPQNEHHRARLQIQVDDDGRVVRLEDLGAALDAAVGLERQQWQRELAIILGTGLHDKVLHKSHLYEVSVETAVANGESSDSTAAYALRFEALQAAVPTVGASDREGKEAAFTVLPAKDAAGRDSGETSSNTTNALGRAVYSVDDGLVVRFEARPRLSGPLDVQRQGLTIERLSAD
jgi:hypothetical protein